MKSALLFTCLIFLAIRGVTQTDATITYLDNYEKPCPQAQAVKYSIRTKENDHWKMVVVDVKDDKPLNSTYYSDQSCTIKNGTYLAFFKSQKVLLNGQYANNRKNGIWKAYSEEGRLVDSTVYRDDMPVGTSLKWFSGGPLQDSVVLDANGNGMGYTFFADHDPWGSGKYMAGKKTGQWTYLHKNGKKCQEVQYAADSAISYTCFDESGNLQQSDCYFEKEAAFKTGDQGWIRYLTNALSSANLPKAYYKGKLYGTVRIQFVVGKDGKTTEITVVDSLDPELDQIAVNVIRQSPPWDPAIQYNRKVKAYRIQPITFPKAN